MLTDRYGNPVSTSSTKARDAYVEGCDLVFSGNPGPVAAFQRAIEADPGFALAHAGKARALQLRGDAVAARGAMADANAVAIALPEREASYMAFYNLVLSGLGDAAVAAARKHLAEWPRDAMVLSPCTSVFGLIGFSGLAGRERTQAELLDGLATHYGDDWWFNCQHAFALDETGQRDVARAKIERAMQQTPRNAHGAHIRAHILYEDGEMEAARLFLKSWLPDYGRDGQLHCHISWHLALCELVAGNEAEAFRIYTDGVAPGSSWGPPLNIVTDATSFLWRAELAGHPRDPMRWRVLHEFAHKMFPRAGIAFADTHIGLSDAVVGDAAGLEQRLREMEELARDGRLPSGPVVPALVAGFAAFLRGDYNAAIEAIEPVLNEHERIGGSRAQRDLVEFTLLKAYITAGRFEDVRRMLAERRPGAKASVPVAGLPVTR